MEWETSRKVTFKSRTKGSEGTTQLHERGTHQAEDIAGAMALRQKHAVVAGAERESNRDEEVGKGRA